MCPITRVCHSTRIAMTNVNALFLRRKFSSEMLQQIKTHHKSFKIYQRIIFNLIYYIGIGLSSFQPGKKHVSLPTRYKLNTLVLVYLLFNQEKKTCVLTYSIQIESFRIKKMSSSINMIAIKVIDKR